MTPYHGIDNWWWPYGIPGVAWVDDAEWYRLLESVGARQVRGWVWSQQATASGLAAAYLPGPEFALLGESAALAAADVVMQRAGGVKPDFGSAAFYGRQYEAADQLARRGIHYSAMAFNWHPATDESRRRFTLADRTRAEADFQRAHLRNMVAALKGLTNVAIEVCNEPPASSREWQKWCVREIKAAGFAGPVICSTGYGRGSDTHQGLRETGADRIVYVHPSRALDLVPADKVLTEFNTDHSLAGLNPRGADDLVRLMEHALAQGYNYGQLLPLKNATIPGFEGHPWNKPDAEWFKRVLKAMAERAGKGPPPPPPPDLPPDEDEDDREPPHVFFWRAVAEAAKCGLEVNSLNRAKARERDRLRRAVRRLLREGKP